MRELSLKVCVIGSGAREEAIKDAVSRSVLCEKIVETPEDGADLIIFGPEQPICDGFVDYYKAKGFQCIGVDKKFSRLESSKLFAKKFMVNNGIKCAKLLPVESNIFPQVVKADGLCKGKGVKVVYNQAEKDEFTRKIPKPYFIEEFLDGSEISVMSYFNGEKLVNFCPARDFKRLTSDIKSPNTGGMGAYCPVDLSEIQRQKLNKYLNLLQTALLNEGADFKGFIYSGLIWSRGDWYVLEYNVRLGDPECQVILNLLDNDFLSVLINNEEPEYKNGYSACLTVAAEGYPDDPVKGDEILLPDDERVKVYFAGVKSENGKIYSNGGRVLSICAVSENPFPVLREYAEKIQMEHKIFRNDINIF